MQTTKEHRTNNRIEALETRIQILERLLYKVINTSFGGGPSINGCGNIAEFIANDDLYDFSEDPKFTEFENDCIALEKEIGEES